MSKNKDETTKILDFTRGREGTFIDTVPVDDKQNRGKNLVRVKYIPEIDVFGNFRGALKYWLPGFRPEPKLTNDKFPAKAVEKKSVSTPGPGLDEEKVVIEELADGSAPAAEDVGHGHDKTISDLEKKVSHLEKKLSGEQTKNKALENQEDKDDSNTRQNNRRNRDNVRDDFREMY